MSNTFLDEFVAGAARIGQALVGLLYDLPNVLANDPQVTEGRAIVVTWVLAVGAALVAYIFGRRRDAENMRQEHSAKYYAENPWEDSNFGALEERILENYKHFKALEHDEIKDHKELILSIWQYYEILSVGVSVGYLSEEYVVKTAKFKIIASFLTLSRVIQDVRIYRGMPLNRYYCIMFVRMFIHEYRLFTSPVELFFGRKLFGLTSLLFMSEYYLNFFVYKAWAVPSYEWTRRWRGGQDYVVPDELLALHFTRNPLDCEWKWVRRHMRCLRIFVIATAGAGVWLFDAMGWANYF